MSEEREFPEGWAVVIGGSGGIGSVIASDLAARGCDVALTFNTRRDAAEAVAREITAAGKRAAIKELQVERARRVYAFFEALAERGPIHTVVHTAGPSIPQPYVADVDPEVWRSVLNADLNGFFNVVHAALPHLRDARGSLVALSTAGLRRHPPGDILSTAPKAAVEAVIRALAREEGRHGVRANAVALGVIDTGMFTRLVEGGQLTPEWLTAALKNTPLRRFGDAQEVAEAVAFLSSRRGGFITGQTLYLDGGYGL